MPLSPMDHYEFLDVMKLELAKMLEVKPESGRMDELAAVMMQSPEMVGEMYHLYECEGYMAFKDALHTLYGTQAHTVTQEQVTMSYSQAMVAWFYRGGVLDRAVI